DQHAIWPCSTPMRTVLDVESFSTPMRTVLDTWVVLDAYEDCVRHLCGLLDASPEHLQKQKS
ncbi:hypothetical protein A2U01_0091548, partial [Trifolium medium]|nr:hypothetical protein [Trifolium medium]